MARVPKYYEYRAREGKYVVRYKGRYCGVFLTEEEAIATVEKAKNGYVYTPKTREEINRELLERDPNYYSTIGTIGGKRKVPKGFAINGNASKAGKIGGRISKRA